LTGVVGVAVAVVRGLTLVGTLLVEFWKVRLSDDVRIPSRETSRGEPE
jgi:hypothetical protein